MRGIICRLIFVFGLTPTALITAADKVSPPPTPPEVVSSTVERAIAKGISYLSTSQRPDGSYSKGRFDGNFRTYPTAMSCLVGLAFFANGSTPTRGPHSPQIRKITNYLLSKCVNRDGSLYDSQADEDRYMYSHAFAMTFLAHVYGQASSKAQRKQLKNVLKRAILFTARAQSPDGGWGYQADWRETEGTLTVTQLQGLRSCKDAGIFVPKEIVDGAIQYIENSTTPNGSVLYRPRSSYTRPGVTCAAAVTLWSAGRYDDPLLDRIAGYIRRRIRARYDRGHHAEYVMYYLAQSRYLLGGQDWPDFYQYYSRQIVRLQRQDGSWEGPDGGEIYGTAIALIALQFPYDRVPLYHR